MSKLDLKNITEQQKKEIRLQLEAELYRKSFYEFFKASTKILYPSIEWDYNWHFEYICNLLQSEVERIIRKELKDKDIIINLPFRSGKSILISQLFPIYCWILDPSLAIMQVSHTESLAIKHSHSSKMLLESEWFRNHFPHIQLRLDTQAKNNYMTLQGGKRISFSIGSSIIGEGCSIMLIDDINNPNDSKDTLQKINETYTDTLYSRLNNPAIDIRIILQQRISENDICGYLLNMHKDKYNHICLPAQISKDLNPKELIDKYVNGLFWPTRFTNAVLLDYQTILGSRAYAGQLMQCPQLDSDSIIKKEWINIINVDEDYLKFVYPKIKNIKCYFVDTAYGGSDADYNAIIEVSKYNNQLYITNVWRNKLEFPQLINEIKTIIPNGSKIYIEGKASGKSVVQQLRTMTKHTIIEMQQNKDKIVRLKAVAPNFENRQVNLINANWNKMLIDELTSNYGVNDDMRDCVVYAIEQLLINKYTGVYNIM